MTITQKVNTEYTPDYWGGLHAVERLPVPGYTHRWSARAIGLPTGAAIAVPIPDVCQPWEVATSDAPTVGAGPRATLTRSPASRPMVTAPVNGQRHATAGDAFAAPTPPLTLAWFGVPPTVRGAAENAFPFVFDNGTGGSTLCYVHSDGRFAITHNGSSITGGPVVDTGAPRVLVWTLAASGAATMTIDDVTIEATQSTAALKRRLFFNGSAGALSVGSAVGELVLWPRVLTATEIADLVSHLRAINGL